MYVSVRRDSENLYADLDNRKIYFVVFKNKLIILETQFLPLFTISYNFLQIKYKLAFIIF